MLVFVNIRAAQGEPEIVALVLILRVEADVGVFVRLAEKSTVVTGPVTGD